jgi:hypothetical protein
MTIIIVIKQTVVRSYTSSTFSIIGFGSTRNKIDMGARRDLSFAGRRVHSIRLLYKNNSMGRVVCELLSTQICGPRICESNLTR